MKRERLVIWVMVLLFVLMAFFFLLGFKDAEECVGNPFVYGARDVVNKNKDTESIYCSCTFGSMDYAPFYFDNDSMGVIRTTGRSSYYNWSVED